MTNVPNQNSKSLRLNDDLEYKIKTVLLLKKINWNFETEFFTTKIMDLQVRQVPKYISDSFV